MRRPLLLTQDKIPFSHTLRCKFLNPNTNVILELPRRKLGLEHLVDLLERPIPCLGHEQDDKYNEDHVGSEPDVPVLRAPSQLGRVDEVGRREGAEPVAQEVGGGREAEYEGAELVVGELSTDEPGLGCCKGMALAKGSRFAGRGEKKAAYRTLYRRT